MDAVEPDLVPAAYPDAKVRYRRGEFSERTGRFAGEAVEWKIPIGHRMYDAEEGAGMVIVPNDGGFVWIMYEGGQSVVPAEFVRPAQNAPDDWTHCANCGQQVKADAPHKIGDCAEL